LGGKWGVEKEQAHHPKNSNEITILGIVAL